MNRIATASVLIQDMQGAVLFVVEKNKKAFHSLVNITDEEYYRIGSSILIDKEPRKITDLQFIYRNLSADFQTVITVQ